MANITAADVNKLRLMSGAGIMDCKHALVETDGDFDKAIDYLRKKGQKVANKRSDRSANEGLVFARTSVDNKKSIAVMVSCETDFVGKSADFVKFVNDVADFAIIQTPATIEDIKNANLNGRTVTENLMDLIGKTGEKMEIAAYETIEAAMTFSYNHPGNRLGTIIGFNMDNVANLEQVGREIAMQVAAMDPVAIDKGDVDQKTIDNEIEIGKEQARQEGKPEDMLEKIALGKLNKFFKERTLLNQEFVRDNKKTVGQYITETNKELKVTSFRRLMIGG